METLDDIKSNVGSFVVPLQLCRPAVQTLQSMPQVAPLHIKQTNYTFCPLLVPPVVNLDQ